MFEYKFIQIKSKGFFGLNQDYQQIIRDHSKQGWRFCQLVPIEWDGQGKWREVELVLERPANWEEEAAYVFNREHD